MGEEGNLTHRNDVVALQPVMVSEKAAEQAAEDAEVLQASIKAGTVAQIVVACIATIGLIYLLKLVLLTTLFSVLLAYVLEPPVRWLTLIKVPRWAGALIVVTLALGMAFGLCYFSYNSATAFVDQLPQYSMAFRDTVGKISARANKIETQASSVVAAPKSGKQQPIAVKVEESQGLSRIVTENGSTILDLLMAMGFIPFIVYFMLMQKDHFHVATVRFFPKEHRLLAHKTVGGISAMIRTYLLANLMLGALNSVILLFVFWFLKINYFYFIAAISGFVSLIPYLGVFLALLPPLAAGLGVLGKVGLIVVFVAVVGLHLITMNVFYPKFVGERLQLNALVVSLSLLFWAWIWGAAGLVLAIPILGAAKIVCDRIEPLQALGDWLGEASGR
jgi:predicted PurR-regulated permease PerM